MKISDVLTEAPIGFSTSLAKNIHQAGDVGRQRAATPVTTPQTKAADEKEIVDTVVQQVEKSASRQGRPVDVDAQEKNAPPIGAVIRGTRDSTVDLPDLRWDGKAWTTSDGVVKYTDPYAVQRFHQVYFAGKKAGIGIV